MPKITKAAVLDLAKDAVADRGLNYGSPEDNFNRIALLWNAWLQARYGTQNGILFQLDAIDVAQMCGLIKDARLANQPNHLDSWVDKAGYAACGANIVCDDPNVIIGRAPARMKSYAELISAAQLEREQ